jgi:protein-tyrosine phosphatase
VEELRKENIDFVVDARTSFSEDGCDDGFPYKPDIERIMRTVKLLMAVSDMGARILVHCVLGMDRTPFVAMVYVDLKYYNKNWKKAYRCVKKRRPQTVYHWKWVALLN